jgi:hypothetical protein
LTKQVVKDYKSQGLRPNWNVGMMERWNNGSGVLDCGVNGNNRLNDKIKNG